MLDGFTVDQFGYRSLYRMLYAIEILGVLQRILVLYTLRIIYPVGVGVSATIYLPVTK